MLTPGQKLQLVRKSWRPPLTQNELAELLAVKPNIVKSWERGNGLVVQFPKEFAIKVAELGQFDWQWFYDESELELPESSKLSRFSTNPARAKQEQAVVIKESNPPFGIQSLARGDFAVVPLWRGIAAGLEEECFFYPPDSAEFMEVPAFMVEGILDKCAVGVVTGSSMAPRINHGERIVMKFESTPPVGSIVIAKNNENGHFVKVLRNENERLFLESLNPKYGIIERIKGWTLVGSVVGIWGDSDRGRNIEFNMGRALRG